MASGIAYIGLHSDVTPIKAKEPALLGSGHTGPWGARRTIVHKNIPPINPRMPLSTSIHAQDAKRIPNRGFLWNQFMLLKRRRYCALR